MLDRITISNPVPVSTIAKYYGMTIKEFRNNKIDFQLFLINGYYHDMMDNN